MIKKLVLSILLLFTLASVAQEGTASPYSFYGIGDVRFKGSAENRFMGGISILSDSIHINLQNPASYAGLKLTTFTVGGSFKTYQFENYQAKDKAQRTTLDYLAVGMPIGKKFGASFGLMPYSSVGYKINKSTTNSYNLKEESIYQGTGGINKVYAGLGYKVNSNLSLGLDFAYNFGTIETKNYTFGEGVQYGALIDRNSRLSGLNVNIGAMYKRKISEKQSIYSGLTFTPESTLKSNNTSTLSAVTLSDNVVQSNDTESATVNINIPSKLTLGFGIGEERKWMIGAEITAIDSKNSQNLFPTFTKATFENSMKYSIGGFYLPKYTSFTNYFDKITYRGGFRYENTGIVVNNESINEQAFTAGVGLPLGGTFSNLNIGAEFGKRGTAKANLVQENFFNLIFSLSVNDLWFVKRKYD